MHGRAAKIRKTRCHLSFELFIFLAVGGTNLPNISQKNDGIGLHLGYCHFNVIKSTILKRKTLTVSSECKCPENKAKCVCPGHGSLLHADDTKIGPILTFDQ